MTEKQNDFIKTVGALARNEYMCREKWILPSVCIAQAILESGWNLNARTLFGIKGNGFVATTSEYYNGVKKEIQASFRLYPDVASSVVGYYDFLATTPRYRYCLNNSDYKNVIYHLQHTTDGLAYATDPEYMNKLIRLIATYNLTEYDVRLKDNKTIAEEVYNGRWGNGEERKRRLTEAGYDYKAIQTIVNKLVKAEEKPITETKSLETIANEVINGRWGNGEERKKRLTEAGYDYNTVQSLVDKMLK